MNNQDLLLGAILFGLLFLFSKGVFTITIFLYNVGSVGIGEHFVKAILVLFPCMLAFSGFGFYIKVMIIILNHTLLDLLDLPLELFKVTCQLKVVLLTLDKEAVEGCQCEVVVHDFSILDKLPELLACHRKALLCRLLR